MLRAIPIAFSRPACPPSLPLSTFLPSAVFRVVLGCWCRVVVCFHFPRSRQRNITRVDSSLPPTHPREEPAHPELTPLRMGCTPGEQGVWTYVESKQPHYLEVHAEMDGLGRWHVYPTTHPFIYGDGMGICPGWMGDWILVESKQPSTSGTNRPGWTKLVLVYFRPSPAMGMVMCGWS